MIRIASVAGAAALLGVLLSGGVPVRAGIGDDNPGIPHIVAAIAAHSRGRMSALGPVADSAWFEIAGVLLQAQRADVPVCVAAPARGYRVVGRRGGCGRSARSTWLPLV